MTGEKLGRAGRWGGLGRPDGKTWHLGGLTGQPERGYLQYEWLNQMQPLPESFLIEDIEILPLKEKMNWARSRWALNKKAPTGKRLTFTLKGTDELEHIIIKLHYDLFDHIPTLAKSMEIINNGTFPLNIDEFKLELLAFSEPESPVDGNPDKFLLPNISIESDYAFGGF